MRARADSVNSRKLATGLVRPSGGISQSTAVAASNHRCSGETLISIFQSRNFFWSAENKIHFFLVDFSDGF
jgi:hypothetical protein